MPPHQFLEPERAKRPIRALTKFKDFITSNVVEKHQTLNSRPYKSKQKSKTLTLTFGQSHQRSHIFEVLSIGYLKANFHNFTTNKKCLRDCQKWSNIGIF